jgi:hypothetical protein
MISMKFMCMRLEHLIFLDSISFLPFAFPKLPEAFGLTVTKSWYAHYFNTYANLDYVGKIPDLSYYGIDEMNENERSVFLDWYESQKSDVFDNRRVLELYCQRDVSVWWEACQVSWKEFIPVGDIDVFLVSITIASACNTLLCKRLCCVTRHFRTNSFRRVQR